MAHVISGWVDNRLSPTSPSTTAPRLVPSHTQANTSLRTRTAPSPTFAPSPKGKKITLHPHCNRDGRVIVFADTYTPQSECNNGRVSGQTHRKPSIRKVPSFPACQERRSRDNAGASGRGKRCATAFPMNAVTAGATYRWLSLVPSQLLQTRAPPRVESTLLPAAPRHCVCP